MIRIRHEATRRYLREHFDEIAGGLRHLAELATIEIGEDVADALPTKILDNSGRKRVREPIANRINDLIDYLEAERDGR